ncbi:MAG TPA: M56 family metallopeptidase [Bryobacteraceae bacterium]|nr:M56 family metallopeptidase [Bryobacteraceae bacterium]
MNTMRLGWTLVHFLWQGALIAIAYAIARRFLTGSNDRYLLGCAALALMLAAPFATWWTMAPADSPSVAPVDQTTRVASVAPAPLPAMVRAEVPVVKDIPWLRWAVIVWLVGASSLSLRLLGGWMVAARLRVGARSAPMAWCETVERLRRQLGVLRSVGLRVSAMVQSPVVVGAWRPLILVPVGMLVGMPAAQVEALLAHELAHIRRHDYLVNLLQSLAEALLFYHPAVWWISGHVRAEREHCCDDAAVALSGDVIGYANALAELAGMPQMRLAAVAANGASLTDRIARLLGGRRPAPARKSGTAAAAVLLAAAAIGLYAQETPRPTFQVASVKLNTDNPPNRMQRPLPGGRWSARNASVAMMIVTAYKVQHYQVVGGPPWMESEGFDIEAKADADAKAPQLLLMLQSLLADRFKLALHRESRELPVYNLVPAKGSFSPPPPDPACAQTDSAAPPARGGVPCGNLRIGMSGSVDGGNVPMWQLVSTLAAIAGRPVIDQTGFTGKLDVHLRFTPDQATQGLPGGALSAAPPDPDPSQPNIFEALQEQLGLKLTSSKGPVEVLVIDHVERPTAN